MKLFTILALSFMTTSALANFFAAGSSLRYDSRIDAYITKEIFRKGDAFSSSRFSAKDRIQSSLISQGYEAYCWVYNGMGTKYGVACEIN